MLQLSVFVVELPAELGSWERSRAGEGPLLHDLLMLNGPQLLLRTSLLAIFRDEQAEVRAFRLHQPNSYLHIRSDVAAMVVRSGAARGERPSPSRQQRSPAASRNTRLAVDRTATRRRRRQTRSMNEWLVTQ